MQRKQINNNIGLIAIPSIAVFLYFFTWGFINYTASIGTAPITVYCAVAWIIAAGIVTYWVAIDHYLSH